MQSLSQKGWFSHNISTDLFSQLYTVMCVHDQTLLPQQWFIDSGYNNYHNTLYKYTHSLHMYTSSLSFYRAWVNRYLYQRYVRKSTRVLLLLNIEKHDGRSEMWDALLFILSLRSIPSHQYWILQLNFITHRTSSISFIFTYLILYRNSQNNFLYCSSMRWSV